MPSDPSIFTSIATVEQKPQSRRGKKLSEIIVQTIIKKIENGEYRIGEKLPSELELIETFDVSRSVVREAITELRSLDYVETRHGIGTFAKQPPNEQSFLLSSASLETINDIIALLELRISLETEAVYLAAERRTDTDIAAMQAALKDFETHISSDVKDGTIHADYDLHIAIAIASKNQYFVDFLRYLGEKIIPRARVKSIETSSQSREDYLRLVHQHHLSIVNAIVAQDGSLSRQLMRDHLSKSIKKFKQH